MTPHPTPLDDDRLLLTLSGEWPDDGRSAGGSAALRQAVARLDGPLTRDAARQDFPPPHAAVRAVLDVMQDEIDERAAATRPARGPMRWPGWAVYPAAAAAVVALLMTGWWTTLHRTRTPTPSAVLALNEPVLALSGTLDADDPARQDDDALARQFDSIIIDQPGGGDSERQWAAMKFLEESVQ